MVMSVLAPSVVLSERKKPPLSQAVKATSVMRIIKSVEEIDPAREERTTVAQRKASAMQKFSQRKKLTTCTPASVLVKSPIV